MLLRLWIATGRLFTSSYQYIDFHSSMIEFIYCVSSIYRPAVGKDLRGVISLVFKKL